MFAKTHALPQIVSDIHRRRIVMTTLCVSTWMLALVLAAAVVSPGHWSWLTGLTVVVLAGQLPWAIIGFWNAVIGFIISAIARDPLSICCPPSVAASSREPIEASTAILMCVRNEDVAVLFSRLDALMGEIVATGWGERFHLYVLSDSSIADIFESEAKLARRLDASWKGRIGGVTYRRRSDNAGFKAGNIRDFCLRYGNDHTFALVLDADSFMSGPKICDCVRVMQSTPRLGILQCLTVGLPSVSPLARLFQFGMRLGMRSYTLGGSWWQADCGPYWGHNALIRLEPFTRHCDLPQLPGKPPFGGDILSHDQIEAVLMRRAGYEVRVVPIEGGSYEENPPTLIEFVRRDLRWCLGNLQYFALLAMPGLKWTSRIQLALAIWMFVASGCNVAFWCLILIEALMHPDGDWIVRAPACGLIAFMLATTLAPKIATALIVLLDGSQRAAWGGAGRFVVSFLCEIVFSFILTPIMQLSETAAIVMLCVGRTIGWDAQARTEHRIGWLLATARFCPHTLVGLAVLAALWSISPATAVWALPVYAGLLLAVPLAVVTSLPALGRWMARAGWLSIPEDSCPPREIMLLGLPALDGRRRIGQFPDSADEAIQQTPDLEDI